MKIEVNKEDLINMILGLTPKYEHIDKLIDLNLGRYCGEFANIWEWNKYILDELDEETLHGIYCVVRDYKK